MVLVAEVTGAHGVGGNVRARLIASNASVAVRAMELSKTVLAKSKDGARSASLTLTLRPPRSSMLKTDGR